LARFASNLFLAAGLQMALACTTGVPAETAMGSFHGSTDRRLFLVAAQQKKEIAASLDAAGFEIADNLLHAAYFLRVTLGNEQGFRSCGTLQKVKYSLRSEDREVLLITTKGWTGSCQPNVFDVASHELAAALDGSRDERGKPEGSSP
jgi:hypothetical protein